MYIVNKLLPTIIFIHTFDTSTYTTPLEVQPTSSADNINLNLFLWDTDNSTTRNFHKMKCSQINHDGYFRSEKLSRIANLQCCDSII